MEGGGRAAQEFTLVFSELLASEGDAFVARCTVRAPLADYDDFAQSFRPSHEGGISIVGSTGDLEFRDDLLGGKVLRGQLGGIKVEWDCAAFPRERRRIPHEPPKGKVYVCFSCSVKSPPLPPEGVADIVYLGNKNESRDGLTNLAYLQRSITYQKSAYSPPGHCEWPSVAMGGTVCALSVDLRARHGAATTRWTLQEGDELRDAPSRQFRRARCTCRPVGRERRYASWR